MPYTYIITKFANLSRLRSEEASRNVKWGMGNEGNFAVQNPNIRTSPRENLVTPLCVVIIVAKQANTVVT